MSATFVHLPLTLLITQIEDPETHVSCMAHRADRAPRAHEAYRAHKVHWRSQDQRDSWVSQGL